MVSGCRACRQGRGIQSEGGHPPAPVWSGEAKLGGVAAHSWPAMVGGWWEESSGEVPVGQYRAPWPGHGGKHLGNGRDSQHRGQAQISG